MPQNWEAPNWDHWFRDVICDISNSRSVSTTENHSFHRAAPYFLRGLSRRKKIKLDERTPTLCLVFAASGGRPNTTISDSVLVVGFLSRETKVFHYLSSNPSKPFHLGSVGSR